MRTGKKKYIIATLLILALGGYLLLQFYPHRHDGKVVEKILYTCPMHPQIVQDTPGDCPICGMKLVPLGKEKKAAEKKVMYKSTMLPGEISDKPGKDSMGMDMVPFDVDDGGGGSVTEANSLPGLAPVTISNEKRVMMGLNFETIKSRNMVKEIRTSTKIVQDETRQFRVTTKVSGYVENLYVNQTGQFVKKGAPLLSIYSPELLAAQQEYLSAVKAQGKMSGMDQSMEGNIGDIAESARERLKLLDITDAQIDRIKKTGQVTRDVTLYSPASGYVMEKTVLKGQKIMENDALMVIVDLSRVWGEADIYESDIPFVRTGMQAELTLSYWPGKIFKGKITFLSPFLDPEARTLKARIEIPNSDLVLKPNMFADAKLNYSIGERIAVPESAVMRTGTRDYVFIEGDHELIVPYEVKLGMRSGDGYYEVLSGLKKGERVVISANFLVDSESSLKAAFKAATSAQSK
ncbi:MAG TPA: efflux RND transporter periplasmic adaptor subunit [Spirochaetota bacterium]|nr:efflux RND transporter periplasmic adaptor subunit [Spirochaetota bacterium]